MKQTPSAKRWADPAQRIKCQARTSTEEYKSSSRERSREYRKNNPDSLKNWREATDPRKIIIYNTRSSAKKRGIFFDLIIDDIIIPEVCPVLGIVLDKNQPDAKPSIDRIDNTKGYVKDNIMTISWRANKLKNDGSLDELRAIVAYMERHLS